MNDFSDNLLTWFKQSGRHDLPWQKSLTPYRVWISEIMLQQTQVTTVIPYFERFMERFPDLKTLACAHEDEVLHLWTGLGYYSRARNLHKTARILMQEYDGVFPTEIEEVTRLPGIGRSTAGAILALGLGQRHPILDGNVKRVLSRYYGISGWPGDQKVAKRLWSIAEELTPEEQVESYTQAIMDLGATVCTRTRPKCGECPVSPDCFAYHNDQQDLFPGRRKKKTLPVRKTVFTIIENEKGEVLLEKRPPAGIWGGLWSFPECPVEENPARWIHAHYGSKVDSCTELAGFRHTFSHFHLEIRPVRAKLKTGGSAVKDTGKILWYAPGSGSQIGLAAPVVKLLQKEVRHSMTETTGIAE